MANLATNQTSLNFYKGGLYSSPSGTDLDHAVTVVGYSADDKGRKYWIVRNSWGDAWGREGVHSKGANGVDSSRPSDRPKACGANTKGINEFLALSVSGTDSEEKNTNRIRDEQYMSICVRISGSMRKSYYDLT